MKGDDQEHKKRLKTRGGQSLTDPIPFDLILEILTRLPPKSLVKFQYVSKTWYTIIRSKDFLKSLVSKSSTPSSQLLISFKNGQLDTHEEKSLFFFTSPQEDQESHSLAPNLDMRMTSMDAYFHLRCASSANGFICLSHKGRFMICNPSTRQVITLPEIPGTNWNSTYNFLGYDPVNEQYKAMCKRVSYSKDDQEDMILTIDQGDQKNLVWRHMEGTTQNYSPLTKGICINGFVYYGAWTPTEEYMDRVVVCFDVRSEKLSFIKPPLTCDIDWGGTSNLINYKGKLANVRVRTRDDDDMFYYIDLWVLQDANKHQWSRSRHYFMRSWWDTKEKIPMRFHGTNANGDIIIAPKYLSRRIEPFYIFYYNVDHEDYTKFRLQGIADDEEFRRRHGIGNNVPPRVWDMVGGVKISFPGTNKAGEIILAPAMLSRDVRPFYIFYCSVETRKIVRVTRLRGIGDNLEFRRSYGFEDDSHVRIAPQHIESIGFLENTITFTDVTDPE